MSSGRSFDRERWRGMNSTESFREGIMTVVKSSGVMSAMLRNHRETRESTAEALARSVKSINAADASAKM